MTEYLDRYPTMHEYAEGKRINPKLTDLIRRADAIEAIDDAIDADSPQWAILRTKIGFLPSAELPKGELISRADAIEAACNEMDWLDDGCVEERKTMIKDALSELPSAEAEPKWNCTANFVAEQLDRLRNMTDEERWDFFIKFFSPSADTVSCEFYNDAVKANIRILMENRELKEQIESAEAEWISVSERLPSDDEYVIVSVLDDHGDTPWKYTTVAWRCNGVWISDNEILLGTAVAWMPLPTPYKGGDTE